MTGSPTSFCHRFTAAAVAALNVASTVNPEYPRARRFSSNSRTSRPTSDAFDEEDGPDDDGDDRADDLDDDDAEGDGAEAAGDVVGNARSRYIGIDPYITTTGRSLTRARLSPRRITRPCSGSHVTVPEAFDRNATGVPYPNVPSTLVDTLNVARSTFAVAQVVTADFATTGEPTRTPKVATTTAPVTTTATRTPEATLTRRRRRLAPTRPSGGSAGTGRGP